MQHTKFKIGMRVSVAECYLADEINQYNETTPQATIINEFDGDELVGIIYDNGIIDFVPQDVLEEC